MSIWICNGNDYYVSFIRPILHYGNSVWSNLSSVNDSLLENVHLAAVHVVTGARVKTSATQLYIGTGYETLRQRREKKIINFNVQNCRQRNS